ncbi:MAG: hypothetical protein JXA42_11715 [Anaerolineales bacterium]|nr:hypothetical protein [Anaerolineales bacterium]
MDIIHEIKVKIASGTVIPKPEAKADFKVKGWGMRRGEEALIYLIPNHKKPNKPYEKGVNINEWKVAYDRIENGQDFSRDWFIRNMPECNKEGECNFTTIGGIFEKLDLIYYERGVYKPR